MAFVGAGFVDTKLLDRLERLGGQGMAYAANDDAADSLIRDAHLFTRSTQTQPILHQMAYFDFEQQRKRTTRLRPGYFDQLDLATGGLDSRYPRMKIALVLKEIQMTPGTFLMIVDRVTLVFISKLSAFFVPYRDVQNFAAIRWLELKRFNVPGSFQT